MPELLEFLIQNVDQFRRGRLSSLYSDFYGLRSTNPDGYTANVATWITGLSKAAEAGMIPRCRHTTLILKTGQDLLHALESQELGQPTALGTVIDEALRRGDLVPQSSFMGAKNRRGTSHNIGNPRELARWLLKQLDYLRSSSVRLPEDSFVITQNLKDASQKIAPLCQRKSTRIERVLPLDEFASIVSGLLDLNQGISQEDLMILLTYLSRDKGEVSFDEKNQVVKLGSSDGKIPIVDEQDQIIASIKSLISLHKAQISSIVVRMEELAKEARAAVSVQNRNAALRNLRASKNQEKVLNQRTETLLQLENVLGKIEEAANNIEVVAALKSGTGVLRSLNAELGGTDTVDIILEGLREELANTEEVGSMLGGDAQLTGTIDDQEIDAQLEVLESNQEKSEKDQAASDLEGRLNSLARPSQTGPSTEVIERPQALEAS